MWDLQRDLSMVHRAPWDRDEVQYKVIFKHFLSCHFWLFFSGHLPDDSLSFVSSYTVSFDGGSRFFLFHLG